MNLPWTIKIVYGIFTDTFPICGSRKRNYIILMGFIQGAVLLILFFPLNSAGLFTGLFTIVMFAGAVMDVVIDGLMVV
jgi:hypothetical protein